MANYIGQCITPKLASEHIAKVTVPVGGLTAGNVVDVNTLDATIAGNFEVYVAGQPTADTLGSKTFAMVVNDGFETLADGRRPAGQPNYYQYTFNAGETATVVFIDKHLVFNVSNDSIDQTTLSLVKVGNYLEPAASQNTFKAVANVTAGTLGALKIVALYNTPIGGNYGGGFATSMICVAQ